MVSFHLEARRISLTFCGVTGMGAKVQEVRDVEEGLGQANLHLHLSGVIFMDPLCCSIKVSMHDLNDSLDWKNVTYKGKAPEVVLGLGNGSDGSPMRAKVGVQWTNHWFFKPVGGWRSDDHNLLAGGAMGWWTVCDRPSPSPSQRGQQKWHQT
jgi:hypothetical protein